jgi:hypothetical protein
MGKEIKSHTVTQGFIHIDVLEWGSVLLAFPWDRVLEYLRCQKRKTVLERGLSHYWKARDGIDYADAL